MSNFFGLTALGPSNSFKNNLLRDLNIQNFTDEEFAVGFDHVDNTHSSYLESHEIRFVFARVYGTEPPESEVAEFLSQFPDVGSKISKEDFLAAIKAVREKAGAIDPNSSTEYKSNEDYQMAIHKHTRLQYGPKEKFRKDQLESHKYGWKSKTDIEKNIDRKPSKQCEETIYAAEMIKTGIYF
jgi:hypothetical protein